MCVESTINLSHTSRGFSSKTFANNFFIAPSLFLCQTRPSSSTYAKAMYHAVVAHMHHLSAVPAIITSHRRRSCDAQNISSTLLPEYINLYTCEATRMPEFGSRNAMARLAESENKIECMKLHAFYLASPLSVS